MTIALDLRATRAGRPDVLIAPGPTARGGMASIGNVGPFTRLFGPSTDGTAPSSAADPTRGA